MRNSVALLTFAAGLSAFATETEYTWVPSQKETDFGIAAVEYETGTEKVKKLTVLDGADDPGTAVITGSDTFEFADTAEAMFSGGSVRLETPVSGVSLALTDGSAANSVIDSNDTREDYIRATGSGTPDLLFPGRKVADYEFDSAYLHSAALQNCTVTRCNFVRRTETSLTFELQALDSSVVKGVKITLVDTEDGIAGSVDYASYYYGSVAYTYSFEQEDQVAAHSGHRLPVGTTPGYASGYCVRWLKLHKIAHGNKLAVKGAEYDIGTVTIGDRTTLELDAVTGANVATAGFSVQAGGSLSLMDLGTFAHTGDLAVNGGTVNIALAPFNRDLVSTNEVQVDVVVSSTTGVKLLDNALASEIISIDVPKLVDSIGADKKPVVCFMERGEGSLRFQLQARDESWLKCAVIEFYNIGFTVYARKICSIWCSSSKYPVPGVKNFLDDDLEYSGRQTNGALYHPEHFDLAYTRSPYLVSEHTDVKLPNTTAKLVVANAALEDVETLTVDHLEGSMTFTNVPPVVCYVKRSAEEIEFQLQLVDGGYTKGSVYRLYQQGADLYCQKKISYWANQATYPTAGCVDMTSPDFVTIGSTTGGMYYLCGMTLFFNRYPSMRATLANLGSTTSSGATINVGANTELTVNGSGTADSIPPRSVVNVEGILNVTHSRAVGSGSINVKKGGVLRIENSNAFASDTSQVVTFDGGSLSAIGSAADGGFYFNSAVLLNGARMGGAGLRVGTRNIVWESGGTSPVTVNNNIKCVSGNRVPNEFTMTWMVADATGDDGVDFYMNGNMTDFEDGSGENSITHNGGMVHKKTGAGTLRWGGTSTCTGLVWVAEGTLLLGASNAINPSSGSGSQWDAKQPVKIDGGTLATAADTSNEAGPMSVVASGALKLGDGSQFSIESLEVAADATLSIAIGNNVTLNVGSIAELPEGAAIDVTGEGLMFWVGGGRLSAGQLAKIRVNGRKAVQDEYGYINEAPKNGAMLLFR